MNHQILAIVGLGVAATPIIKKAKEMGIKTVGFGQEGSLEQNSVDVFIENDIFDIDGMYNACLKEKVTGVIASSEISTESAAYLADRLGLPGNSVKNGFFGRNKYLMRQRVEKVSTVLQPKFYLYDGKCPKNFPVVVKSVDSCGKQGITLVTDIEHFSVAVDEAKRCSSDSTVLIEEYIEGGKEYSIECIAAGDICSVVQITQKDSFGPPHFVETGHHQPAYLKEQLKNKIKIAARDILRALQITCGMAHLEVKIKEENIYFIEVGARAGGSHIGDVLTALSTNFDYVKAAIECSFGIYKERKIENIAYTGIYYHVSQNKNLDEVFRLAQSADWVVSNTIREQDYYPDASYNNEREKAGYIIYCADHKIGMRDVVKAKNLHAERINDKANAFEMIWNHNKEIGRDLTDEELKKGVEKFIRQGDTIAIVDDNHIIGFLLLYCNNLETLSAYICNVYVLENYRGCDLSKEMMDKAISICKERHFKQITLHVKEDNIPAVKLYQSYGFNFTGNSKKFDSGNIDVEMALNLK